MHDVRKSHLPVFIGSSIIAAIACGSVVLTGLMFPSVMLNRTRPLSIIIFMISLSILMASLGACVGFPEDGTPACTYQAVMLLYWYPASWCWTAMLVLQLRSMIMFKKFWLDLNKMNIICWGLPLIALLLPRTTSHWGREDLVHDKNVIDICLLAGKHHMVWLTIFWTGFYFVGFFFMVFSLRNLYLHIHRSDVDKSSPTFVSELGLWRRMRLYPLVSIITWLPLLAVNLVMATCNYNPYITSIYIAGADSWSSQVGTAIAVIFFYNCKRARVLWYDQIFGKSSKERSISLRLESDKCEYNFNQDIPHESYERESSITIVGVEFTQRVLPSTPNPLHRSSTAPSPDDNRASIGGRGRLSYFGTYYDDADFESDEDSLFRETQVTNSSNF